MCCYCYVSHSIHMYITIHNSLMLNVISYTYTTAIAIDSEWLKWNFDWKKLNLKVDGESVFRWDGAEPSHRSIFVTSTKIYRLIDS